MNDSTYQTLLTLKGRPYCPIVYNWCYDPFFVEEACLQLGYQPSYLRDFKDEKVYQESHKALFWMYYSLRQYQFNSSTIDKKDREVLKEFLELEHVISWAYFLFRFGEEDKNKQVETLARLYVGRHMMLYRLGIAKLPGLD